MAVRWVEHKGKRVLYGDFRHLTRQQMMKAFAELANVLASTPGKVRWMVDFEGCGRPPDYQAGLGKSIYPDDSASERPKDIDGLKDVVSGWLQPVQQRRSGTVIQ
jgi:hypothetical protein